MYSTLLLGLTLLKLSQAQQAGNLVPEVHPLLSWQKCTTSNGCITQTSAKVVLDANWRWVHDKNGYANCYSGNHWDATLCPDPQTCAANCALEGADYSGIYGISTSGSAITLKYGQSALNTAGSRIYLMSNDSTYEIFKVKNQEFTFDVDVSNLPCAFNGALYFSEMAADGGISKYPGNKAGAKYGTGYCDSRCPKDLKFINGEANVLEWTGSLTDPSAGSGRYGSCCNEMDVWDANSFSTTYTPHPCTIFGQTRCSGFDCSSGYCDPAGCDFNPYRLGDKTFYGKGMTIDTTKKITVVTQFITVDGTATGTPSEIRRLYVQDGKAIQNSKTNIPGMATYDSVTDEFCAAQKAAFGDPNIFAAKGGLKNMGKAFDNGMVLAMSIWYDSQTYMRWLDSNYPVDADPSSPGMARGSCPATSGIPIPVEGIPTSVTFSNVRSGDIGSTYNRFSTTTM